MSIRINKEACSTAGGCQGCLDRTEVLVFTIGHTSDGNGFMFRLCDKCAKELVDYTAMCRLEMNIKLLKKDRE